MSHQPSRRAAIVTGGALFASAHLPRIASAAGARDPRLVVIVLRGALDGLSTVAPIGDPDYAPLHGALALGAQGANAALPLDGFFALNPAMTQFHRLYRARQALIFHAIATNYRERSHFDGQDVLESGQSAPGHTTSGWLNRTLAALPSGARIGPRGALGVGVTTPLILRGPAPTLGWAPPFIPSAGPDTATRLIDLYTHRDPQLAEALRRGLETDRMAKAAAGDMGRPADYNGVNGMRMAARGAAQIIAADDGPRVAALAFDGWDTHANEGGATGRLAQLLGGLDAAFGEFEQALGPKWRDAIVVAVTEFGRTARINGTTGTDHGTATVALAAGGALAGGRVIANWPGLAAGKLYQDRDLAPTTDLRAALKGLIADHLGVTASALAASVFPDTAALAPMRGLLAA
ncbi:MAG: DUF1501 domain-containing protein [Hyphomicrobiales bacterium]|nr:DUF1501 domain-containing protein [Hyphomicrobiales bacterium]